MSFREYRVQAYPGHKKPVDCVAWDPLGGRWLLGVGARAGLRGKPGGTVGGAGDVGDRFAGTYAEVHGWVLAAMDDDVPRGRAALEAALARWSRLGFHAMHFWRLYGELTYDLYADAPERGEAVKTALDFWIASCQFVPSASRMAAAERGTANRIAAWNGASWSAFGIGFTGPVYALEVFDGQLIAATFRRSNGVAFGASIARSAVASILRTGTDPQGLGDRLRHGPPQHGIQPHQHHRAGAAAFGRSG